MNKSSVSNVFIGKTLMKVCLLSIVLGLYACDDNPDKPVDVDVQTISEEMAAVRDYVPLYAVMAHRGSTYWAPEETESAWRWAREMGADYLESDLQCSKDGVIIANHDDNLKRTTNIEEVFGSTIPATRMQFYESLGFSHEDALEQYQRDEASFQPYYMQSYYYAELLMLDAGKWFGEAFAASRNGSFIDGKLHYSTGQYVSTLSDQIAYADGRMLNRKDDGERILPYSIKPEYQGKTLHEIWQAIAAKGIFQDIYMDFLKYDFTDAYVSDPQDTGHRPGIYIEFKEPEVNPDDMEQRVYDILDSEGWNIITKPATETAFYVNGKVNVGRTNGKVILQTFSNDALTRAYAIFKGRVPMCYLLWINVPPLPGDFELTTPDGFAQAIKYGLDHGAHIIGPSIAGEPNNYDELNAPWQAELTRRSGMLNHPYSFDTQMQMEKYVSPAAGSIAADGCFTNRSELSLQYMIDNGFRCRSDIPDPFHPGSNYDNSQAISIVPDAIKTLERLGYSK
jgi:glycerophosphoryl diester phosphodiesterase